MTVAAILRNAFTRQISNPVPYRHRWYACVESLIPQDTGGLGEGITVASILCSCPPNMLSRLPHGGFHPEGREAPTHPAAQQS